MKKAIVTVLIGERVSQEWDKHFRGTWEVYCKKHGYELCVIRDYIDKTEKANARQPHWQKLLILEHDLLQTYDCVVWLDHDVSINFHSAPCIVSQHDSSKIGLVSEKYKREYMVGYADTCVRRQYKLCSPVDRICLRYERAGLPPDVHDTCNTGVAVYRRREHAQALRYIYDNYDENQYTAKDEVPMSYHLFKHELVEPLDPRFNALWFDEMLWHYPFVVYPQLRTSAELVSKCVTAAWRANWFMHFTADIITSEYRGQKIHYRVRDDVKLLYKDFDI